MNKSCLQPLDGLCQRLLPLFKRLLLRHMCLWAVNDFSSSPPYHPSAPPLPSIKIVFAWDHLWCLTCWAYTHAYSHTVWGAPPSYKLNSGLPGHPRTIVGTHSVWNLAVWYNVKYKWLMAVDLISVSLCLGSLLTIGNLWSGLWWGQMQWKSLKADNGKIPLVLRVVQWRG